MVDVRRIYPDCIQEGDGSDWFAAPYSYAPMLETFGNILLQVDDQDYQGDSRVLYEKDGKYGYLLFGWGSCSGCDALQGCNSYGELQDLANTLEGYIMWMDPKELLLYFVNRDWAGNWEWDKEQLDFLLGAIPILLRAAHPLERE